MRRTRISAKSKKQKEKDAIYGVVAREYASEHQVCEVCNKKWAEDIHHIAGRLGTLMCDPTNFLAVCRECHKWIHANGREAREKGYLK